MSSTTNPTEAPPADLDGFGDLGDLTLVEDLDTIAESTLGGCGDDNPYR